MLEGYVRADTYKQLKPLLDQLEEYGELCHQTIYRPGVLPSEADLDTEELTLELEFFMRPKPDKWYRHHILLPEEEVFYEVEANDNVTAVFLEAFLRFIPAEQQTKKST